MNVGFIGAGKVGTSLGQYFIHNNIHVCGFFSKSRNSAEYSAKITDTEYFDSIKQLLDVSDVVFITVPDNIISEIWQNIKETGINIKDKTFCHCSGVLSSEVFDDISSYGAYGCSMHPMNAVSSKDTPLNTTLFTIEGEKTDKIEYILGVTGNKYQRIDSKCKVKYHTAAVFASNLMVALAKTSVNLLTECGFDENSALEFLTPLILQNAESITKKGCMNALTGPVERNDTQTVQKHLECLDDKYKNLYIILSEMLVEIAEKKYPERNYNVMKKELCHEKYSINLQGTENK